MQDKNNLQKDDKSKREEEERKRQEREKERKRQVRTILIALAVLIGLGLVSIAIYSEWTWLVFAGCLMIACASLVFFGLLGFLFGIPLSPEQAKSKDSGNQNTSEPRKDSSDYKRNTSLEQVSDWLTKIIVGVGLTQLNNIPPKFIELARYLAAGIGGESHANFVLPLIIYFGVVGFVLAYIVTRTSFLEFLREHEKEKLEEEVVTLKNEVKQQAAKTDKTEMTTEMFWPLYQPDGYEETIKWGRQYIRKNGEPKNANFWIWLACAYGQKYTEQKKQEPQANELELKATKDEALHAVKRALDIDRSWSLSTLQFVWDPEKHKGTDDNDLEAFYSQDENDEFRKLLGEGN